MEQHNSSIFHNNGLDITYLYYCTKFPKALFFNSKHRTMNFLFSTLYNCLQSLSRSLSLQKLQYYYDKFNHSFAMNDAINNNNILQNNLDWTKGIEFIRYVLKEYGITILDPCTITACNSKTYKSCQQEYRNYINTLFQQFSKYTQILIVQYPGKTKINNDINALMCAVAFRELHSNEFWIIGCDRSYLSKPQLIHTAASIRSCADDYFNCDIYPLLIPSNSTITVGIQSHFPVNSNLSLTPLDKYWNENCINYKAGSFNSLDDKVRIIKDLLLKSMNTIVLTGAFTRQTINYLWTIGLIDNVITQNIDILHTSENECMDMSESIINEKSHDWVVNSELLIVMGISLQNDHVLELVKKAKRIIIIAAQADSESICNYNSNFLLSINDDVDLVSQKLLNELGYSNNKTDNSNLNQLIETAKHILSKCEPEKAVTIFDTKLNDHELEQLFSNNHFIANSGPYSFKTLSQLIKSDPSSPIVLDKVAPLGLSEKDQDEINQAWSKKSDDVQWYYHQLSSQLTNYEDGRLQQFNISHHDNGYDFDTELGKMHGCSADIFYGLKGSQVSMHCDATGVLGYLIQSNQKDLRDSENGAKLFIFVQDWEIRQSNNQILLFNDSNSTRKIRFNTLIKMKSYKWTILQPNQTIYWPCTTHHAILNLGQFQIFYSFPFTAATNIKEWINHVLHYNSKENFNTKDDNVFHALQTLINTNIKQKPHYIESKFNDIKSLQNEIYIMLNRFKKDNNISNLHDPGYNY